MHITVKMPKLADTTDQFIVLGWQCAVGQNIAEGQTLMEVETDKVDAEVPSPVGGMVAELLVAAEDEVRTGTPICVIDT